MKTSSLLIMAVLITAVAAGTKTKTKKTKEDNGNTKGGTSTKGGSGGGGGGKGGVSAFHGEQSGIGSWYRASASGDSTNGHSWCGYPYNDQSPVFAPDIQQMTNGTNPVYPNPLWKTYTSIYCGLEAKVWNPANGKSMILYIGDSFDHRWVKTPGSIDIMKGVWSELAGKSATNKNDVIKGVKWELTGKKSAKYSFGGPGN